MSWPIPGMTVRGLIPELGGGVSAGLDGHQRIVSAVKDERWNGKPPEHLDARAVCHDRGKLAADAGGIVGSIERRADLKLVIRRPTSESPDCRSLYRSFMPC